MTDDRSLRCQRPQPCINRERCSAMKILSFALVLVAALLTSCGGGGGGGGAVAVDQSSVFITPAASTFFIPAGYTGGCSGGGYPPTILGENQLLIQVLDQFGSPIPLSPLKYFTSSIKSFDVLFMFDDSKGNNDSIADPGENVSDGYSTFTDEFSNAFLIVQSDGGCEWEGKVIVRAPQLDGTELVGEFLVNVIPTP